MGVISSKSVPNANLNKIQPKAYCAFETSLMIVMLRLKTDEEHFCTSCTELQMKQFEKRVYS